MSDARQTRCSGSLAVEFEELPDTIWQATVASEDRTFWENNGVDFQGLLAWESMYGLCRDPAVTRWTSRRRTTRWSRSSPTCRT